MRHLGDLPSHQLAERFFYIALSEGLELSWDKDDPPPISLWIINEEATQRGKELFAAYCSNPNDDRFLTMQARGLELFAQSERLARREAKAEQARKRQAEPSYVFTVVILIICVFMHFFANPGLESLFRFSSFYMGGWFDLYEIREGQIWRLVTPIFLHGGLLHLGFNMLWFVQLGREIESRIGAWKMALLIISIAIPSHMACYWVSGPNFVGISGVLYGFVGFIWAMERYQNRLAFRSDPQILMTFVVWYVFCVALTIAGMLPVANTIHGIGGLVGLLVGFVMSGRVKNIRSLLVWHKPRLKAFCLFLGLILAGMFADYWASPFH